MTAHELLKSEPKVLVWREPKIVWSLVVLALGVAVPAFVLFKLEYFLPLWLGLPAAVLATIAGSISTAFPSIDSHSRMRVILIFLKWGGYVVLLFCSVFSLFILPMVITNPDLVSSVAMMFVAPIFGLIVGVPWALWVGLLVSTCAMVWREDP